MYSAYKLNKEGDNAMENSVEVLWKTENRVAIWSSYPILGQIDRENHNCKRYMHSSVHSNTVYNRQDMEAT